MGSDLQICPPLPCKAIPPCLTGLMGAELHVTNSCFQTTKPKCFPVEGNIKPTTSSQSTALWSIMQLKVHRNTSVLDQKYLGRWHFLMHLHSWCPSSHLRRGRARGGGGKGGGRAGSCRPGGNTCQKPLGHCISSLDRAVLAQAGQEICTKVGLMSPHVCNTLCEQRAAGKVLRLIYKYPAFGGWLRLGSLQPGLILSSQKPSVEGFLLWSNWIWSPLAFLGHTKDQDPAPDGRSGLSWRIIPKCTKRLILLSLHQLSESFLHQSVLVCHFSYILNY